MTLRALLIALFVNVIITYLNVQDDAHL